MLTKIVAHSGTTQTALAAAFVLLLVTVASLLLLQQPAEAQSDTKATSNLAVSSPNPGELVITWDAPGRAPDDYRVTGKKSGGKWTSYRGENTVAGGNALPAGRSHTVSNLEEGTEYSVRVRARYEGERSGPWSPSAELTIAALPDKPAGLSTNPSHDNVVLTWTDPGDGSITGYRILRGPDAANLAVLADNTGTAATSYTDSTVAAETGYAYVIRARNAHGLGPQTDGVSAVTPAAPAPPAKPTITGQGSGHSTAFLTWADPGDDSITGYQILRGLAADTLTVLVNDTGSAGTTYTDETVEPETEYFYAIKARNTVGLSPQSDTVGTTTQPAPPEVPDQPVIDLAIEGVEFIFDAQQLDTTGTCSESDITAIAAGCIVNIHTKSPVLAVQGTVDSDDRLSIKTGRDKAAVDTASDVADADDLRGTDQTVTLTLPEGRSLLRLWGDDDEVAGDEEEHFFRVNVMPYWEWNGDRLSKDSACQSATARTAAQITNTDCILSQIGKTAELQFHNVISDHFNAYVDVNTVRKVNTPGDTALASPFTVNLESGENVVRVRLAAKGSQPHGEVYHSNAFYYKVTTTPPAKPTGLLTGASHDTVILFWTNPDDDTITGYQILRGPDAANLTVLTDDTGDADTDYADNTVEPETPYVYAVKARNAVGLSPQSDTASTTTLAPPPEEDEPLETGEQTLPTPSTTRANATVVTFGDVMLQQRHAVAEGNIPSGGNQNQWVRYSVTAGRYYQFEVRGVGQGVNQVGGNLADPSLRVETMSGTVLGSDNNSGDSKNAHLKFFAVETQDVIFRISDAADPDAGGDYTVLIREERLAGEGTDCTDDRGSPNCNLHTKEFNSALSGNTASRREGWLSAGDADYWAFSINGAGFTDKGTIRIWVIQYPPSGAGALQHPKIELYDNHDNVIAENDHHLGTQRAKVRYKEIDHSGIGIYYLRVSSTDGGAGAYVIVTDVYDTP